MADNQENIDKLKREANIFENFIKGYDTKNVEEIVENKVKRLNCLARKHSDLLLIYDRDELYKIPRRYKNAL